MLKYRLIRLHIFGALLVFGSMWPGLMVAVAEDNATAETTLENQEVPTALSELCQTMGGAAYQAMEDCVGRVVREVKRSAKRRTALKKLQEAIDQHDAAIASKDGEIENLLSKIAEKDQKVSQQALRIKDLEADRTPDGTLQQLQNAIASLKEQVAQTTKQRNAFKSDRDRIQDELTEVNRRLPEAEKLAARNPELENDNSVLAEENGSLKLEIKNLESAVSEKEGIIQSLNEQIATGVSDNWFDKYQTLVETVSCGEPIDLEAAKRGKSLRIVARETPDVIRSLDRLKSGKIESIDIDIQMVPGLPQTECPEILSQQFALMRWEGEQPDMVSIFGLKEAEAVKSLLPDADGCESIGLYQAITNSQFDLWVKAADGSVNLCDPESGDIVSGKRKLRKQSGALVVQLKPQV